MNKNAVIIGAGLAGLSAGIRLQQTGMNDGYSNRRKTLVAYV